jgi:tetratricopeptide (TPR) repeat protein
MNPPVTSQRRPFLTLIVLCATLMGMTSCFLFNGDGSNGGDSSGGGELPMGDITTFEVASMLSEAGRYDEALLVYLEAIQADPNSEVASNAMNEIGGIYIQTQEYEKSLQTYEDLLVKFPAYKRAEEVQKKIEFVQKALEVQQERTKVAKDGATVN